MQKIFLGIALLMTQQIATAQQAVTVTTLSEQGQPMLFLPHIGCPSDIWLEVAEEFKDSHACYLFDFAGFAGMPALTGNYTQSYVDGIRKFIAEKRLTDCILVGQNYGGYVAVKVAELIPDKVQKLVLSDFYPRLSMIISPDVTEKQLDTVIASVKMLNSMTDTAQFAAYQRQLATAMNFSNPDMVERFVGWQQKSDRATLTGTLTEQLRDNLLGYFGTNKIPTLAYSTWYFAIHYKNMPLSEAQQTLDGYFVGAQNVTHAITESSKDFIANDQPEWFVEELKNFLKRKAGAQ